MLDAVSFVEIDGQYVELLPVRTVMSIFSGVIGDSHSTAGDGGGGGGGGANGGHGTVESWFLSNGGDGGTAGAGGQGTGGVGVDPSIN